CGPRWADASGDTSDGGLFKSGRTRCRALLARRMGGAKRYPSTTVDDADGFRKVLNPSYELRAGEVVADGWLYRREPRRSSFPVGCPADQTSRGQSRGPSPARSLICLPWQAPKTKIFLF